jgi:hypothetical protein
MGLPAYSAARALPDGLTHVVDTAQTFSQEGKGYPGIFRSSAEGTKAVN